MREIPGRPHPVETGPDHVGWTVTNAQPASVYVSGPEEPPPAATFEGWRALMLPRMGVWTSVEESLPPQVLHEGRPIGVSVLAVFEHPADMGRTIETSAWNGEEWDQDDRVRSPWRVTHWMPLPELP